MEDITLSNKILLSETPTDIEDGTDTITDRALETDAADKKIPETGAGDLPHDHSDPVESDIPSVVAPIPERRDPPSAQLHKRSIDDMLYVDPILAQVSDLAASVGEFSKILQEKQDAFERKFTNKLSEIDRIGRKRSRDDSKVLEDAVADCGKRVKTIEKTLETNKITKELDKKLEKLEKKVERLSNKPVQNKKK